MLIVMVLDFAGLLTITALAYRNAPPIPAQMLDARGSRLFSGDDTSDGQTIFLKYGLMDNGSIRATVPIWVPTTQPRRCTASARTPPRRLPGSSTNNP